MPSTGLVTPAAPHDRRHRNKSMAGVRMTLALVRPASAPLACAFACGASVRFCTPPLLCVEGLHLRLRADHRALRRAAPRECFPQVLALAAAGGVASSFAFTAAPAPMYRRLSRPCSSARVASLRVPRRHATGAAGLRAVSAEAAAGLEKTAALFQLDLAQASAGNEDFVAALEALVAKDSAGAKAALQRAEAAWKEVPCREHTRAHDMRTHVRVCACTRRACMHVRMCACAHVCVRDVCSPCLQQM